MNDRKETPQPQLLYVGKVGETDSALGVHARNMAQLFSQIGYQVTFICSGEANIGPAHQKIAGFDYYYTVPRARNSLLIKLERLIDDLAGWKEMRLLRQLYPKVQPAAIILYGNIGEGKLIRFCRKRRIPLLAERTDWFERSDFTSFRQRWIFQPREEWYMRITDRKLNGVIAISHYFEAYYRNLGVDVIRIPPVFPVLRERDIPVNKNMSALHLVYAGSLGEQKDKILPVLEALRRINSNGIRITLDLVGIDMEALTAFTDRKDWVQLGVTAYGHCPHEKAREIVSQADFSLLLREKKRYARAGFSTKFAESMCMGVPVICTKVGGSDQVITDMQDGVHLKDNEVETVLEKLQELLALPESRILEMKRRACETACDIFSVSSYEKSMKAFLDESCRKAGSQ